MRLWLASLFCDGPSDKAHENPDGSLRCGAPRTENSKEMTKPQKIEHRISRRDFPRSLARARNRCRDNPQPSSKPQTFQLRRPNTENASGPWKYPEKIPCARHLPHRKPRPSNKFSASGGTAVRPLRENSSPDIVEKFGDWGTGFGAGAGARCDVVPRFAGPPRRGHAPCPTAPAEGLPMPREQARRPAGGGEVAAPEAGPTPNERQQKAPATAHRSPSPCFSITLLRPVGGGQSAAEQAWESAETDDQARWRKQAASRRSPIEERSKA